MGFKTIPQLPTGNLDVTREFYGRLGFTERARWPEEYMILERDGLELHFWYSESVDPLKNDASCYVRFDTAKEAHDLYEQWTALGLGSDDLRAPVETDYGLLEFALIDKHGNLIRLGGPVSADV
jgi:catechol 2,3-dioxygenase-like lactoylglutathione lyase family enzyme